MKLKTTKRTGQTAVLLVAAMLAALFAVSPAAAATPQEPAQDSRFTAVAGEVVVEFADEFLDHTNSARRPDIDRPGLPDRQPDDHANDSARDKAAEVVEQIQQKHRERFSAEANEQAARNRRNGADTPTAGGALTSGASVVVGGFTVVYNGSEPTPAIAKPAIEAGIAEWADQLSTNGAPVVVEVSWRSFGNPGILGFAGPTGFFTDPSLPSADLYPAALTNVLTGLDANGAVPEIAVALNSDLAGTGSWYYGTGTPASNQIDLATVVTHEMGHGVGFVTSANNKTGTIELASPPFAFDSLMQQQGTPLPNVGNVHAVLTSNDADIKISSSQVAPLFVPPTWYQGTSGSHLLNSGATAKSLMAPTLNAGTTNRSVDGYTLGVLDLVGWPIVPGPIQPSITSTSVNGTSVTVNWSENDLATGLPADSYSVEAYAGATKVASTTAGGAARSTIISGLRQNTNQEVWVVPIRNGQRGTAAKASVTTGDGPDYGEPGEPPAFVRDLWLDHQVFRVYQAHFLRTPDKPGFDFWFDQRARGASLLAVINEFQASTEFVNRYGSLSDGQFVQLVYQNVLGRDADSGGFNHWTAQLAAGVSRGEMMLGFVESPEYIRRTSTMAAHSPNAGSVLRLYQAYFLREPSAADLSYWQSQVDSGVSLTAIADHFAGSTEFTNRYGSLSNSQFVNLIYENVLGRPADSSGFAHWTAQLAAGMSRGQVMLGFSESVEFIKSTGTMPQVP